MNKIEIKRISANAKIPTFSTPCAACADLYAAIDKQISIPPFQTVKIPTGLIMCPPKDYMIQILQRSGLASKGIFSLGGVIDNDYRGEIIVILHNSTEDYYVVKPNDKIAQFALRKFEQAEFEEVDSFESTERGDKGFGSTGR